MVFLFRQYSIFVPTVWYFCSDSMVFLFRQYGIFVPTVWYFLFFILLFLKKILCGCNVDLYCLHITVTYKVISNCICGVIVFSELNSIAVDCRFESWSGKIKDNTIIMCCFSTEHASLKS